MKSKSIKNKVVVIVGTTASGKTRLGVELAVKYNGEIVSADSRQVYKGMDVGTGKDLREYKVKSQKSKVKNKEVFIKYHLIDVASPKRRFSLAEYQKKANEAIEDILKRGKLPIIVGGTGLYAQALVDGYVMPDEKPNIKKRKELDKKAVNELYNILFKISQKFAKNLNRSDRNNKRRLIRYIEMLSGGERKVFRKIKPMHEFLVICPKIEKDELHKRIYKRLIDRLKKEDMVGEIDRLHNEGLGWKRLEEFGLEYKYIAQYLQEKIDHDEMVEKLFLEIKKFAKRQMTWLRRWEKQGREINWVEQSEETEKIVKDFLAG